ncbi:MAG: hypothetical protein E7089_03835 [Bacteroidales bacterium]|nr:hypothetical protein [Bacteroidales bacterium]
MKHIIPTIFFAAIMVALFSSCTSARSGGSGANALQIVDTKTKSVNAYDLDIATEPVEYTIDVSTAEGRQLLNKMSLRQAQELVLRECIMKHKCGTIFNPQYTHLKKGKRILRITVFGFPAWYKNK